MISASPGGFESASAVCRVSNKNQAAMPSAILDMAYDRMIWDSPACVLPSHAKNTRKPVVAAASVIPRPLKNPKGAVLPISRTPGAGRVYHGAPISARYGNAPKPVNQKGDSYRLKDKKKAGVLMPGRNQVSD